MRVIKTPQSATPPTTLPELFEDLNYGGPPELDPFALARKLAKAHDAHLQQSTPLTFIDELSRVLEEG